jgi:hypothetical protein
MKDCLFRYIFFQVVNFSIFSGRVDNGHTSGMNSYGIQVKDFSSPVDGTGYTELTARNV